MWGTQFLNIAFNGGNAFYEGYEAQYRLNAMLPMPPALLINVVQLSGTFTSDSSV